MTSSAVIRIFVGLYLTVFFAYLFLPLFFMVGAAFNDSRFPSVLPWQGGTLKWFGELFADPMLGESLVNSLIIGLGVVALSVPIGLAAALLLTRFQSRARTLLYGVMVSPVLTPGVILGISTLVFWRRFDVAGGILLTVLAQTSFIASYCMLMFMARLQRFDPALEEAALDLGASHLQAFRRIVIPFLMPAILSAAFIAFLQSFENYNTTLFVYGSDRPLTVYLASKVRIGLTPAVNALAVIFILLTVAGAIAYELLRRRERARSALARAHARLATAGDDRGSPTPAAAEPARA
ncbi:ABC transporter permease [Rhodospirillaceae bacterium SYSU D60014]|uniref:ABC transporter permease n=1 Tax=Virgifigura deserti TaxID=2268457 RepID=UPI000E673797